VTPIQSISETDIMPASYATTSYANILCQLMPTQRYLPIALTKLQRRKYF
jgi:hypothetical protein